MNYQAELQNTGDFLNSDQAVKFLRTDPYWPKWNSTWWHMLLLHEMGETQKIPSHIIEEFVASLNRYPLKIFPIHPGELPRDVDPYRGYPCHCQLGNVYQVLAAWGVNVDKELPWIKPWFFKYQMSDGGLNCDNDAYLVKNEVPSSMVGTISPFEAVLFYSKEPWTTEESKFINKAAQFLMDRKLMLGSPTVHNARERDGATKWVQLCFPRFYLYDVLRGLNALLIWSEKTKQQVPKESIQEVVTLLKQKDLRNERYSYSGVGTLLQNDLGEWLPRQSATVSPLLNKVSEVGVVSPFLTKQWAAAKVRLEKGGFL